MTSFDDLLTKAEAAPVPHRDVDVWLGEDVSDQITDLEQQLAEVSTDLRFGDSRPAAIQAEIDEVRASAEGELVVLRFRKMSAGRWAEIVARAPQRVDAPIDRAYGYNVHVVGQVAASTSGVRLDGDTEEPLSPEQWDRLFQLLSGHEFQKICNAIFDLNEYAPEQRILSAKKASRAGSGDKST